MPDKEEVDWPSWRTALAAVRVTPTDRVADADLVDHRLPALGSESDAPKDLRRGWRLGRRGGPGGWASYWGQEQRWVELAESPTGADDPGRRHSRCGSSTGWSQARDRQPAWPKLGRRGKLQRPRPDGRGHLWVELPGPVGQQPGQPGQLPGSVWSIRERPPCGTLKKVAATTYGSLPVLTALYLILGCSRNTCPAV
jgi:hypothetical protein